MNPTQSVSTLAALDLGFPGLGKVKTPEHRILDLYGLDPVVGTPKPKTNGLIAAVKRAFESIESLYQNHIPYYLRERVKWIKDLTKKAYKLISNIVKLVLPFIDVIRNTAEAAASKSAKYMKVIRKMKILSALTVGVIVYDIAMNIEGLVKSIFKKDLCLGVDKGLMIVDNVGDVAELIETILSGLKEFGVLAATETLKVACTALVGVSTIHSVASIVLNAKHWYQSAQFRSRIEQKFGKEANFGNVVAFVNGQKKRTLHNRFGVKDGGELKVRLNAILQKDRDNRTPKTKDAIKKAMHAMKKRLITKDICHGLKILAGVISIVACAVLLFTPIAPLGFALLATATAIGIVILVTNHLMTMQFKKTMNTLSPDNIQIPPQPRIPVLKNNNDPMEQKKFAEDMEKYNTDLRKHKKAQTKFFEELKYVTPIRDYKWKSSGRKKFRKKVNNLIHWKPKKRKVVNENTFEMQRMAVVDPKVISRYFFDRVESLKKADLRLIEEKHGGMTFEGIKNWTPAEFN